VDTELAEAQAALAEAEGNVTKMQFALADLHNESKAAGSLEGVPSVWHDARSHPSGAVELAGLEATLSAAEAEVQALRVELAATRRRTAGQSSVIEVPRSATPWSRPRLTGVCVRAQLLEAALAVAQRADAAARDVTALHDVRCLCLLPIVWRADLEVCPQRKLSSESVRRALQMELEDVLSRRSAGRTVRTVIGGKKSTCLPLVAWQDSPADIGCRHSAHAGQAADAGVDPGAQQAGPDAASQPAACRVVLVRTQGRVPVPAQGPNGAAGALLASHAHGRALQELVPLHVVYLEGATVARGAEPYMLVLNQQLPEPAMHVLLVRGHALGCGD
jgi:hypothetical protein